MSEAFSEPAFSNNTTEGLMTPRLSVVAEPDERPPKMTPEETAFRLARGPYAGRLLASWTLLRHAEEINDAGGYKGLPLAAYVLQNLRAQVARRRTELRAFEQDWRSTPVTPTVEPLIAVAEPSPESAPELSTPVAVVKPVVMKRTILPTVHPTPRPVPPRRQPASKQLLPLTPVKATRGNWQDFALCAQADPEAHFPEKGESTKDAKRVCLSCEAREQCLEYALDTDQKFGVWGGLSERERRKLKKKPV